MRFYLSPSGQTHNQYAYGNTTEAAVCREIATNLKKYLESLGHKVMLASPYKNDNEFYARATDSDNFKADYHVAIHTNAGGGHGVRIYCNPSRVNEPVMSQVKNAILNILPDKYKIGKVVGSANLYEINKPKAKSVYIECAFHDNLEESKWIVNNIDNIAKAICEGLTGAKVNAANKIKLYRVIVGSYSNRSNAEKQINNLKKLGIDCFIEVK